MPFSYISTFNTIVRQSLSNSLYICPQWNSVRYHSCLLYTSDFGTYFINTIIVTAFSVIIVLIMTMMAGYAMGRYKFLGRNLCMVVFLASIAIPLVSTIIPTYEVVKGMNLVGTKLGLILSQAGGRCV